MTTARTDTSGRPVLAAVAPSDSTRTLVNDFGALTLVLFLLATTRWGSYILPGPPYFADLCLAVLVVDRLLALPIAGRSVPRVGLATSLTVGALLLVTFIAVCLGPIDSEAFRDAVPFIYGVFVFLAPPLKSRDVPRATRLITIFFGFHLLWTTVVLALPSVGAQVATLGNPGVDFFSARSDVDGFVNGIAASVGLFRVLQGRRGVIFFAWGLVLVLVTHSRGGLLATILGIVCVIGYALAQNRRGFTQNRVPRLAGDVARTVRRHGPRSLPAVTAALVVIAIVGIVIAPTSVERLTGTFGGSNSTTVEKGAAASGTTSARLNAWSRLVDWIGESEARTAIGAGFGSNVMLDSGAGVALVHSIDPSLRAPHNFLLTVWAHLGLLGVTIILTLFFRGYWLAAQARRLRLDDVQLIAALILIGMPVVAVVGVVMESPFGAIPYFWAFGYLSTTLAGRRARSVQ
jgi:hypothetical protein